MFTTRLGATPQWKTRAAAALAILAAAALSGAWLPPVGAAPVIAVAAPDRADRVREGLRRRSVQQSARQTGERHLPLRQGRRRRHGLGHPFRRGRIGSHRLDRLDRLVPQPRGHRPLLVGRESSRNTGGGSSSVEDQCGGALCRPASRLPARNRSRPMTPTPPSRPQTRNARPHWQRWAAAPASAMRPTPRGSGCRSSGSTAQVAYSAVRPKNTRSTTPTSGGSQRP